MSSGKAGTQLEWSFGLRNSAGKYLTAETFQNKIVCAASIMKKKQIFFLEQSEGDDCVYIKSHLGKYLTVDGDGKFLGSGEGQGEEEAMLIEPQADGAWAIKSKKYGWYCGGSGEDLSAFVKTLTLKSGETDPTKIWTIHLAMHPQINLRNVMRKAYCHMDSGSFATDEIVPWGEDATITLHFNAEDGTYGLVAADGQFLTATGALGNNDDNAKFIIEFQGGQVSFKAKSSGKYVTALGAKGTLKASKSSITKDEQFVMEDSFPQIALHSKNGKYISTKQGVELAAFADTITNNAIFQVEPLDDNGNWAIKSGAPKYWNLDGVSVQATETDSSAATSSFAIEWRGAQIALKASNGKYVAQMMNNYLHANVDEATEENGGVFTYEVVNRPRLVLRGEFGFVGTLPSGLLECNKSAPEIYTMVVHDGKVQISHANGKFWKVGSNGVSCSGTAAEDYAIELYDNSMLCLKMGDKYFQGAQNGAFTLTGTKADKSTHWEY